jgi:L-fucose isomerase-like protein
VSNSRGARPVTCAITTKSDLRTLRLERLTETSKNFSDVALSRDRDLHIHLEITAKTRTDLAQKKNRQKARANPRTCWTEARLGKYYVG